MSNVNITIGKPLQITVQKVTPTVLNPLVAKTTTPTFTNISQLADISMDNPVNNSVLIYNSADNKFHLDQLSLDGGPTF